MVLDDEQNGLFFDVMDSLLYYVNERFRVVENFTLDYASPLDDVKSSLVAHALWENVAIIDDFVRENPYRLPKRCLDIAQSWKCALPGVYTLVRYQSGRALLMNDAGVFSVCGVTYELEQEIGPAPAYVEMVLIPFEDLIIYDGFLQAYDTDRSVTEQQRIQDEFENRCAQGIVSTAGDFAREANRYIAAQRDKEFDELLADMSRGIDHGEETLPDGFHRGVLAGLTPDERQHAIERHAIGSGAAFEVTAKEFDKRVRRREPVSSLAENLSFMTKAQLESIAQVLGMGGLMRLKKAEMIKELSAELANNPEVLVARLVMADENDYAFARKLASGGRIDFALENRLSYARVWPIEPYVCFYRGKAGYTAIVPDELRALFAQVDFEAIDRVRRQQSQALRCIDACIVFCGVVSIDDAYDQYRSLVSDVMSREDFGQMAELEAMMGNAGFDIWTYQPHDYLVHYTLTPDYVAEEYARSQRAALGSLVRNSETGEVRMASMEKMVGRIRSDLASELEWLEQYKRDLVESQSNLSMKPLNRTVLENDVIGELLDDGNVVRLREYLDERVPDGADDYTFADQIVESIVLTSIESGSVQEAFAYALNLGLDSCSSDGERLPLLITNVFNAMPSWENNGWSPQELYEQVTGRKVFFNEDGTIMRLGADDPCPCGSGLKYRECCGR